MRILRLFFYVVLIVFSSLAFSAGESSKKRRAPTNSSSSSETEPAAKKIKPLLSSPDIYNFLTTRETEESCLAQLTISAAQENKEIFYQLFDLSKELLGSPAFSPYAAEVVTELKSRIEIYLAASQTDPTLKTQSQIKPMLFENFVMVLAHCMYNANIDDPAQIKLLMKAWEFYFFVCPQWFPKGVTFGQTIQRFAKFESRYASKSSSYVGYLLDPEHEKPVWLESDQANFIALAKKLIVENLVLQENLDGEPFSYWAETLASTTLGKNRRATRPMQVLFVLPYTYAYALKRAPEVFRQDVDSYLKALDQQSPRERKKNFNQMMQELETLFTGAKILTEQKFQASQTRHIQTVPVPGTEAAADARFSAMPHIVKQIFTRPELRATLATLHRNKTLTAPFDALKIPDEKIRNAINPTVQFLIEGYLRIKGNYSSPNMSVEQLRALDPLFPLLIDANKGRDVLFNIRNAKNGTVEELAELQSMLDDLVRVNQQGSQLYYFVELTKLLFANNIEICTDIYFSVAKGAQRIHSPRFNRIILHPEESDASLEMRAWNFYHQLQGIWGSLKDRKDFDDWLQHLAQITVGGVCMEGRSKSLDTAFDRIAGKTALTINMLTDMAKPPIEVSRIEFLNDVVSVISGHFAKTFKNYQDRFVSLIEKWRETTLKLPLACSLFHDDLERMREALQLNLVKDIQELERQKTAPDYVPTFKSTDGDEELSIVRPFFANTAHAYAPVAQLLGIYLDAIKSAPIRKQDETVRVLLAHTKKIEDFLTARKQQFEIAMGSRLTPEYLDISFSEILADLRTTLFTAKTNSLKITPNDDRLSAIELHAEHFENLTSLILFSLDPFDNENARAMCLMVQYLQGIISILSQEFAEEAKDGGHMDNYLAKVTLRLIEHTKTLNSTLFSLSEEFYLRSLRHIIIADFVTMQKSINMDAAEVQILSTIKDAIQTNKVNAAKAEEEVGKFLCSILGKYLVGQHATDGVFTEEYIRDYLTNVF